MAHTAVTDFKRGFRMEAETSGMAVRWTAPEQLHLTLKFLGNVERQFSNALTEAIAIRAAEESAFEATLTDCSAFGAQQLAQVLVLRLTDPSDAIGSLAKKFDTDAATAFGVPREPRTFVPHVTLGRLKQPTDITKLLRVRSLRQSRDSTPSVSLNPS